MDLSLMKIMVQQEKYHYSWEPIPVVSAQSHSQSHYQEVSLGHLLKHEVSITISKDIITLLMEASPVLS